MGIISDLNNIKIEDLTKLDYKKLADDLRKQPENIVMVAVILMTVFWIFYAFQKTQKDTAALRSEQAQLEERMSKIETYKKAKASLDEFLARIPPEVTETNFVGAITDLAKETGIKIVSLTPRKSETGTYFEAFHLDISISAQTFDDMWRFISRVENAPFAMRVDSWFGSPGSDEKSVTARLLLTAINLKKL